MMNANFEHPSYTHVYTIPSSIQHCPSQKDLQSLIIYVSIRLHQDTIGKCTCRRPRGMAGWPMDSWLVASHMLVSASPPPWWVFHGKVTNEFNVFKSRKPIMIITLHTQSVKFDWIPPLTPVLDWYFGILSIESRTIHKRLQDCQSLDIIYIYICNKYATL